ncbi:glycoside hydrolase domain-containing protein [Actinomadura miaoliensis]|uniref:Uncharacterized protein n=1 Tax=Actinomadura miaoliensis TaxID=430685 RepID=A0ABP7VK95_9ACTN
MHAVAAGLKPPSVTGSINGVDDAEVTIRGNTAFGWAETGGFCGAKSRYRVYFHATFDRPVKAHGTWKDDSVTPRDASAEGTSPPKTPAADPKPVGRPQPERARTFSGHVNVKGPGTGAYLQFDSDSPVQMRVGLSYVSVDGARRNLQSEIGGRGFDAVRASTRDAWRRRLAQVKVTGGDTNRLRTFCTAPYHAFLQPYIFEDVDGTYTGFDHRTHEVRPGHHGSEIDGGRRPASRVQIRLHRASRQRPVLEARIRAGRRVRHPEVRHRRLRHRPTGTT